MNNIHKDEQIMKTELWEQVWHFASPTICFSRFKDDSIFFSSAKQDKILFFLKVNVFFEVAFEKADTDQIINT